jgi:hypothetical protein
MNATQTVLGWWSLFIHSISIHINELDLSLSFVRTVAGEVAYFFTVEIGIIDGMRLVGVSDLSLEVLVSSSSSSLVLSSSPIGIGSAKVHCNWLVVYTGWCIGDVILWGLLSDIVGVISPVEEGVSLLVALLSY